MTDKNIQAFIDTIAPVRVAYENITFKYLAVRRDDDFYLVQARLFLNVEAEAIADLPPNTYKSANIRAGKILLTKISDSIEGFINQLLTGIILIEGQKFIFQDNGTASRFGINYQPFHPEGTQNLYRLSVLTISGAYHAAFGDPFEKQPSLDWEVMANDIPYGSLQELAYDYRLGVIGHDKVTVEIIAQQVAAIAGISQVNGEKAMLAISISKNLPKEHASIGYSIQHDNKTIKRGKVASDALDWSSEGSHLTGKIELSVHEGSVLHCFATFANSVQHHYWIMDSSKILNPRRAAYEAFDSKLTLLKEAIGATKNSRDLEKAVSCLLWILGFSVTQIDGLPKIQNPVDLIAVSPKGHYIVIECTTGILKEDNKLPKLHDRASAVKKQLASTGNNTFNVLPVLVTSKKHDEIKMELEQAEKHGILVVAREELDAVLERLIFYPNPDQIYDEAQQKVKEAEAKYPQRASAVGVEIR